MSVANATAIITCHHQVGVLVRTTAGKYLGHLDWRMDQRLDDLIPRWNRKRENPRRGEGFRMEVDGIEPTTSCLQSTRSPN